MARPTTKTDLLEAATTQYEKLQDLIQSMSEEEQAAAFLFEDRDKNLRDVLIHLHEWQNMMKKWYQVGTIEGGTPATPAEGYTWRTTPELNQKIWQDYQKTSLTEAKELLATTHAEVLALIQQHSNEEIFGKKVYAWTKTSTLGAYFIGATSSHYDWAMKKIRKQIRLTKKA
ncbi:hypothetical protein M2139_002547 [Enterococcus sp. PF1-24]|uniref:ClbS/DfsB family four-helix bundle protein n=1 Tax=unclassified Enterococcus TaxID=2608891 RepID=UPI00247601FD|nr:MULTISPECIES: ClbS/DfsB family four-helix bundle protein [unclassified Enterococcus]MDH6365541.1 hypothetical protein [Enterococcus sp. PFB1-1]MDH6402642.1 hypothetical protein [Enterococcus sp. PF1-24]